MYSTCNLSRYPITVSWSLAEDTTVWMKDKGLYYHSKSSSQKLMLVCVGSHIPSDPQRNVKGPL